MIKINQPYKITYISLVWKWDIKRICRNQNMQRKFNFVLQLRKKFCVFNRGDECTYVRSIALFKKQSNRSLSAVQFNEPRDLSDLG